MIRTVSALLYRFNGTNIEVLLHKHKHLKEGGKPIWLGVGGKVEPDEHESDALIREVFEESGISLVYNVLDGNQYDYQRFPMIKPRYVTRINLDNGDTMFDHVYQIEIPYSNRALEPEHPDMQLDWYEIKTILREFNLYNDTRCQIENLYELSGLMRLAKQDEFEKEWKVFDR
jgi:8-oxo-dGTP pyrophosphatase MutT (NUDIX family)